MIILLILALISLANTVAILVVLVVAPALGLVLVLPVLLLLVVNSFVSGYYLLVVVPQALVTLLGVPDVTDLDGLFSGLVELLVESRLSIILVLPFIRVLDGRTISGAIEVHRLTSLTEPATIIVFLSFNEASFFHELLVTLLDVAIMGVLLHLEALAIVPDILSLLMFTRHLVLVIAVFIGIIRNHIIISVIVILLSVVLLIGKIQEHGNNLLVVIELLNDGRWEVFELAEVHHLTVHGLNGILQHLKTKHRDVCVGSGIVEVHQAIVIGNHYYNL